MVAPLAVRSVHVLADEDQNGKEDRLQRNTKKQEGVGEGVEVDKPSVQDYPAAEKGEVRYQKLPSATELGELRDGPIRPGGLLTTLVFSAKEILDVLLGDLSDAIVYFAHEPVR